MTTICPRCGEDVCIRLDLHDGDQLTCTGCESEYTVSQVREMVEAWGPLLAWLDAHPARQQQAEPAAA